MNSTESVTFDLIDANVIKRYASLLWQWIWLVVLFALIGGVGAYFYSNSQTPIYQTSTRILVSRPAQEQSSDLTRSLTNQQISDTYIQFAKLPPVLQQVSTELNLPVSAGMITPLSVPNTQIIQLNVRNSDPKAAVKIANKLVEVLIKQSELIQSGRYDDIEANLNVQIDDMSRQMDNIQSQIDQRNEDLLASQKAQLESQIASVQSDITSTQAQINVLAAVGTVDSQTQLIELRGRLAQLQALLTSYQQTYTATVVQKKITTVDDAEVARLEKTLSLYQQIYLNLINNRENVRLAKLQNTPNVVQLDQPNMPVVPILPDVPSDTTSGALAGLVLALIVIFVIDFLDDSIKSADEIRRMLGLNVMGYIGEIDDENTVGLYIASQPRSPISEAFRTLRTGLEFASVDKPIKSLLITSSGPGEGKTTVSTNLAGALAQGGKRVILIDADLRRPNVHRMLGLTNRYGLSDVFRGTATVADVVQTYNGPNGTSFRIISTGALPPNPAELISSARMASILEEAGRMSDILIVDCAPLLVTDPQVLATRVDGTLIVIHTGVSKADATRYAVARMSETGARILGVVMNRIQRRHSRYGTYYAPYKYANSAYFNQDVPAKPASRSIFRIFQRQGKSQKEKPASD